MPFGCGVSIRHTPRSDSIVPHKPPNPLGFEDGSPRTGAFKENKTNYQDKKDSPSIEQDSTQKIAESFFNPATRTYLTPLMFIEDALRLSSSDEGEVPYSTEEIKKLPPRMRVYHSFSFITLDGYRFTEGKLNQAQLVFSLDTSSGITTRGSNEFILATLERKYRRFFGRTTSLSLNLGKDGEVSQIFLKRAYRNKTEEAQPLKIMGIGEPKNGMFESYALVFPDLFTKKRSFLLLHPNPNPRMTAAR
jgi:hypothetical protein